MQPETNYVAAINNLSYYASKLYSKYKAFEDFSDIEVIMNFGKAGEGISIIDQDGNAIAISSGIGGKWVNI